jgi:hypothetical protein
MAAAGGYYMHRHAGIQEGGFVASPQIMEA